MIGALFSDKFNFRIINFKKYHHTDNGRGSPMNYIAYMLKGKVQIVSKHTSITVNEGDAFFIPINLPYQSYWYGNDEIEFLSYGFSGIEGKENLNFDLQIIDCDGKLKNQIKQIPTEGTLLSCKTLGVFYGVLSETLPLLKRNYTVSKKDEILKTAKSYIENNTNFRISDIARKCFVSEPYLYMLFREKAGCTPNEYRLSVMCKKGIEYLLSTDKTVEEISSIIGFGSASHFRRTVKLQTGLTPKEIRKKSDF